MKGDGGYLAKAIPYEENHKELNGIIHKKCSICDEWKEMSRENFYHNKSNKVDGFNPYCIVCTKNKSDKWAQDNWDKRIEQRRKTDRTTRAKIKRRERNRIRRKDGYFDTYFENNPEKQKVYQRRHATKKHEITLSEWDACRLYFDYRCAYCGKTYEQNQIETKKDLHKEHIVDDGANDLSNCVPACRDCNSHKWEYELDDWYNENNPIYDEPRYNKIIKWIKEDFIKNLNTC